MENGTTRSRVSFFLNRFRKLGFIDYHGGDDLQVHSSTLNIVKPLQNQRQWPERANSDRILAAGAVRLCPDKVDKCVRPTWFFLTQNLKSDNDFKLLFAEQCWGPNC